MRFARGVIGVLGGVLFAAAAVTAAVVVRNVTRTAVSPAESALVGVKLAVLITPTLAILALAWRLDPDEVGGLVVEWGVLVGVSVAAVVVLTGIDPFSAPGSGVTALTVQGLTALNVGCLLGTIIGAHAETARSNARLAERRRDDFVFLNQLLRHHVLNAVTIIRGRAELLDDDLPAADREHVSTIRERSDRVAALVETVQTVANALSEESTTSPVDVTTVLAAIASDYRDLTDAEVGLDAPSEAYVSSNGALDAVFDHLLENAVEHNDGDAPRVEIDVVEGDETVTVTIADDGPGFTEDERADAFEPGEAGDSGLGLYAVGVLVSDCGGTVTIDEDSAVVVTLPSATPAS